MVDRPDAVSAMLTARAQGSRVENVAARTQSSSTFANPDGTWTTQDSGVPVQFQDPSGDWRTVDTGLLPAGETTDRKAVGPALTPADITFAGPRAAAGKPVELAGVSAVPDPAAAADAPTDGSGGIPDGDGSVVPAGRGSVSTSAAGADAKDAAGVSLAWAGPVPTPVTSGDTNTYPGILPGVDLKLRALRTGFEDSWVISDLASGQAQATLTLPLTLANSTVTKQADGSYALVGKDGTRVGTIAAPVIYDARKDAYGDPVAARQLPMTVTTTATGVILTISGYQDYLADPATVFPVTIDPATTTVSAMFDTFVQQNVTTDLSTTGSLHLGNFSGYQSRTFMTWRTATFGGTRILKATLNLFEAGANTCTAEGWQLWSAAPADTSTRWTNQPTINGQYASASNGRGYTGCPGGVVNMDATSWLQGAVSGGLGTGAMMLRAADETDPAAAKVFASSENSNPPTLTVTYDKAPNTPAVPRSPNTNTYAGNPYTPLVKPTLSTQGTDSDGSRVQYKFEIHTSTSSTSTVAASCTTGLVASGAAASCAPATAVPAEKPYWVTAQSASTSRASRARGPR